MMPVSKGSAAAAPGSLILQSLSRYLCPAPWLDRTAVSLPAEPAAQEALHAVFVPDDIELACRWQALDYQGLPLLFYRAALPLSSRTLNYATGIIRRHLGAIGSRWRKLNPGQQALLVLAYLRTRNPQVSAMTSPRTLNREPGQAVAPYPARPEPQR